MSPEIQIAAVSDMTLTIWRLVFFGNAGAPVRVVDLSRYGVPAGNRQTALEEAFACGGTWLFCHDDHLSGRPGKHSRMKRCAACAMI